MLTHQKVPQMFSSDNKIYGGEQKVKRKTLLDYLLCNGPCHRKIIVFPEDYMVGIIVELITLRLRIINADLVDANTEISTVLKSSTG